MSIRTVGIVGTGVIGASWTGLFLARGLEVLVSDPAPNAEEQLIAHIKSIWPTLESTGLAPGASIKNMKFVGKSLGPYLEKVDLVQENAPEKAELKTKIIAELDAGTRPDVIIASSSSGLPSSQFISGCKKNPGRVLIGHPFNPPHLMPLVEVVPNPRTDPEVIQRTLEFYRAMGRSPVLIKQEIPGFAANRLQAVLCSEAYSLVSRGVLSAKDLDACVTTSLGPRWAITGPLMANAMGGGGGTEGFRHLLEHLGPASQKWVEDSDANRFGWGVKDLDKLTESVGDELKNANIAELEKQRDRLLVQLFKLKAQSS